MQLKGLNEICSEIHAANVAKGFYVQEPIIDRSLMLIIGEVSEAHEALRKDLFASLEKFNDPAMDNFFKTNFEQNIKNTFEDEIADTIIRLFDFCGFHGIDIETFIELKLKYNETRPYKHGKKF